MYTIAFYNFKGGVGKTSTAVNIAQAAANDGWRTLLWDLDPQGSSSWFFGLKPSKAAKASKIIDGKLPLGKLIQPTPNANLDVIPADMSFRHIDVKVEQGKKGPLDKAVGPLGEDYALTLLDCPPSLSHMSDQIFDYADAIFVPLIPSHLSMQTYEKLLDYFDDKGFKKKKLHPFLSMVDRRRKLHQEFVANPPIKLKRHLRGMVPYASVVEKMGEHRAPVSAFAPRSPVALAYRLMWEEIKATLQRR